MNIVRIRICDLFVYVNYVHIRVFDFCIREPCSYTWTMFVYEHVKCLFTHVPVFVYVRMHFSSTWNMCVNVHCNICIRAIMHVYGKSNCSYTWTRIVRIRELVVCIREFWFKYISICTSTNACLRENLRLYNVPLRRNSCLYTNKFCSYTNTNFYVERQHIVPLRRKVVRLQSPSTSNFAPLRMCLYVERGCSYTNMLMFVYKHKFHVEARIEM